MDILYNHAKFGGDAPLHDSARNKSWEFLFLFVTLWISNLNKVIQIAILSPFVGKF